jgi:hypothetical protein
MKYLNKEGVKFVQEELLRCKTLLETCKPEELGYLQNSIKIYRSLLAQAGEKEEIETDEDLLGL